MGKTRDTITGENLIHNAIQSVSQSYPTYKTEKYGLKKVLNGFFPRIHTSNSNSSFI